MAAVELLQVALTAAAAASSLATIVASRLSASRARHAVRELEAQRLEVLLASPTLEGLGRYLETTLGGVDISEYITSPDVASRVDRYLDKLDAYLEVLPADTPEFSFGAEMGDIGAIQQEVPERSHDFATEPFRTFADLIRRGDIWTGLARLRLHIEVTLRERLSKVDPAFTGARGAAQMARVLKDHSIMSAEDEASLRAALGACNRAVHGFEVDPDVATDALATAHDVLSRLPPAG